MPLQRNGLVATSTEVLGTVVPYSLHRSIYHAAMVETGKQSVWLAKHTNNMTDRQYMYAISLT